MPIRFTFCLQVQFYNALNISPVHINLQQGVNPNSFLGAHQLIDASYKKGLLQENNGDPLKCKACIHELRYICLKRHANINGICH